MVDQVETMELTDAELKFLYSAVNVLWKCPKCEAGLLNGREVAITAHQIQLKIETYFKSRKERTDGKTDDHAVASGAADGVPVAG